MSILFNKKPLTVNVELAEIIGLNEAIVLQQIHFWLKEEKNFIDGKYWVYNSIPEWRKQFKFWSESTVKRVFESLTKLGVLFFGEYNRDKRDRTKWYSINYEKLNEIVADAKGQNDLVEHVNVSECKMSNRPTLRAGQNDPTITKEYTKNTTKITTELGDKSPRAKKSSPEFDPMTVKPNNLTHEVWQTWVNYRTRKKSMLPESWVAQAKMLSEHWNPTAVINQSIQNGWTGLFPEKIQANQPNNTQAERVKNAIASFNPDNFVGVFE